jgi:hypothetical protein
MTSSHCCGYAHYSCAAETLVPAARTTPAISHDGTTAALRILC